MISFGGGVNSIAMTIMLFKRGHIMPVVFADTMAEHPETYCYLDYFEREFMTHYGQKIIRLNPIETPDFYPKRSRCKSIEEYCIDKKIVPFMNSRFCSQDWKTRPMATYAETIQAKKQFIGFALDESHRAEGGQHIYPLLESKVSRRGCIEIIQAEGLSRPLKSGCFFCPMQGIPNWEALYRRYPDLFNRAIRMERLSRRAATVKGKAPVTLRQDGVPLTWLRDRFDGKGGDLFPDFDFEELTPCACML